MRVFQRGASGASILTREDAREKFLLRATQVMQEGLYVDIGGELTSGEPTTEQLQRRLPGQRCRPIPGRVFAEHGNTLLHRIQGGELITADQITGLFPKPVVEAYRDVEPVDDQYLSIFRTVPSDGAGEQYRKNTYTVNFKKTVTGEEPSLQTYSGELETLLNEVYQALVGYDDLWLKNGQLNLIEELTAAVREGAAKMRAEYFYGKLVDLGANGETYATSWCASINGAIARLRRANKLGPNQTPIVCAPVEMAGDILQAVKDSLVTGVRGLRLTQIPDLLFTTYLADDEDVLVVPPKSAMSDFIDQEREALNAVQDAPGALRLTKVGWRMIFAGAARNVLSMEKIEQT